MNKASIFLLAVVSIFFIACGSEAEQPAHEPQYRMAIELVLQSEAAKDSVLASGGIVSKLDLFHWKNHIVLYGAATDTVGLGSTIRDLPLLEQKTYATPFYSFDRELHCPGETLAGEWKDYLLTANLVADPQLQREYMEYHDTQFEQWPEVARGFCQADFQQLLVFRNGRQLMLVISIPAGRTLDELNPRTTENNPRVVEWNQLMGKYQEGIAGTEDGTVWVFLDPH